MHSRHRKICQIENKRVAVQTGQNTTCWSRSRQDFRHSNEATHNPKIKINEHIPDVNGTQLIIIPLNKLHGNTKLHSRDHNNFQVGHESIFSPKLALLICLQASTSHLSLHRNHKVILVTRRESEFRHNLQSICTGIV